MLKKSSKYLKTQFYIKYVALLIALYRRKLGTENLNAIFQVTLN